MPLTDTAARKAALVTKAIDHLGQSEAIEVAGYLGNIVGRGHGAQMSPDPREQWLKELRRNRSRTIDTPPWLWRSVVRLVQDHEGGYLEHCRCFAHVAA